MSELIYNRFFQFSGSISDARALAAIQSQINLLQDKFSLAKNWSQSKIRAFAYCMAHHRHVKGEYIYRQGEPAHNLYIVFRGKVGTDYRCSGGCVKTTGRQRWRKCFPRCSFYAHHPRLGPPPVSPLCLNPTLLLSTSKIRYWLRECCDIDSSTDGRSPTRKLTSGPL